MGSPPRVALLVLLFVAATVALHFGAVWAQSLAPAPLGLGRWFPVSYGSPRVPTAAEVAVAAVTVLTFAFAGLPLVRRVPARYAHAVAALVGCLAILGTTAAQGIERGFAHPLNGAEPRAGAQQYWHDAARQNLRTPVGAARFVRDFAAIQPTLKEHARTHPPGAVLLFALLRSVTGNRAALAAVLLCAVSIVLIAYGFALSNAPPDATLLFCALPAAQIYCCATLDALVAGLLFVTIAAHARGGRHTLFAGGAFLAAASLTFGVVWAVPVLLAAELAARPRRLPARTAAVLAATAVILVALRPFTGLDYLAAFRWASHSENPHGFRLLADPANYAATRIGDVADIAFFAAPFVLFAAMRGAKRLRAASPAQATVCLTAWGTLLALFLSGAFRTGETARACLFAYPFIVIPAVAGAEEGGERDGLIVGTFIGGAVLQCVGFYFW